MILEINALDCLFFRNGRSFNRGSDSWADGLFPPPPSVLYGALRTLYFADHPEELGNAGIKEKDPTSKLKITNIWFQVQTTAFLPAPLDIVEKKDKDAGKKWRENRKKQYEGVVLKMFDAKNFNGNFKTKYLGYFDDLVEDIPDAMLTPTAYKSYVKGKSTLTCHKVSDYVIEEPKIGIARNKDTHTAAEGHLYRIGMLRLSEDYSRSKSPQQFKILVEFEGLEINEGVSRLGAEGKIVQFKTVTKASPFKPHLEDQDHFRITLNTPAIFKTTTWNPNDFFKKLNIEVELKSAIVGKEQRIGGFDMVKREPKIMYSMAPAGSTFYYKALNKTSKEVFELIKKYSSVSEVRGEEGFGLYHFSSVDFENLIYKEN